MRFLHISDLHLGKVIHGVSMLDNGDQRYWIDQFLALANELRPDAVVIAGDVYDRGSPSGEAVQEFSRLVEGLAGMGICVLMTAGNHDSGQRLSFARDLLARQDVHIAGTVESKINGMNVSELEALCLSVMKKELNAIVNLGALIGFIIGIVNSFI